MENTPFRIKIEPGTKSTFRSRQLWNYTVFEIEEKEVDGELGDYWVLAHFDLFSPRRAFNEGYKTPEEAEEAAMLAIKLECESRHAEKRREDFIKANTIYKEVECPCNA